MNKFVLLFALVALVAAAQASGLGLRRTVVPSAHDIDDFEDAEDARLLALDNDDVDDIDDGDDTDDVDDKDDTTTEEPKEPEKKHKYFGPDPDHLETNWSEDGKAVAKPFVWDLVGTSLTIGWPPEVDVPCPAEKPDCEEEWAYIIEVKEEDGEWRSVFVTTKTKATIKLDSNSKFQIRVSAAEKARIIATGHVKESHFDKMLSATSKHQSNLHHYVCNNNGGNHCAVTTSTEVQIGGRNALDELRNGGGNPTWVGITVVGIIAGGLLAIVPFYFINKGIKNGMSKNEVFLNAEAQKQAATRTSTSRRNSSGRKSTSNRNSRK
eukprot:GFYU01002237.1.p1 GENE.GFYU01002237.1~~GFYU01002237.1.p1  ORF type:complete len:323 (+),score=127.07 GFYU01002237.1:205-1173(+)